MTLKEIKQAVIYGERVYWMNKSYEVILGANGLFLIRYKPTGYCRGLTHSDGVTLNENTWEFFKG